MAAGGCSSVVSAVPWDYDEQQIDGWDYDIDAQQIRAGAASDESGLLALIAERGLQPTRFNYPWDTDDPR